MGDTGDDFRAWDADKKAKKAANKEWSTQCLIDNQINFETKNGGAHLIIKTDKKAIDYWPSTGKWIVRGGRTSRGVNGLVKFIKQQ